MKKRMVFFGLSFLLLNSGLWGMEARLPSPLAELRKEQEQKFLREKIAGLQEVEKQLAQLQQKNSRILQLEQEAINNLQDILGDPQLMREQDRDFYWAQIRDLRKEKDREVQLSYFYAEAWRKLRDEIPENLFPTNVEMKQYVDQIFNLERQFENLSSLMQEATQPTPPTPQPVVSPAVPTVTPVAAQPAVSPAPPPPSPEPRFTRRQIGAGIGIAAVAAAVTFAALAWKAKRRITRVVAAYGLSINELSMVQRNFLTAAWLGNRWILRYYISMYGADQLFTMPQLWNIVAELYYHRPVSNEEVVQLRDIIMGA